MALAIRRVGLFRALLAAHAQAMVNRTRKGLGRRGVLGLVGVIVILLAMASPLFATSGFLGYLFGRSADQAIVAPLMGGVLAGITVGFGVIGGFLGSARQLTWEAYRSFPVPFRTLFFAETFASLGDLVVIGFLGVTVSLGAAFVWECPSSLPFIGLVLMQLVLWVLFLQHLVGALAVTAVRRLRRALVVLVVATWAGLSVLAGAVRELRDDVHGGQADRLRDAWSALQPYVDTLPPVMAVRGIAEAQEGEMAHAVALQLPMAAVTLLLGAASYALLRRENRPALARSVLSPAADRRFRKAEPVVWTMARLHLHYIASSLQGRFGLIVPLITVVLVKGPLGAVGIGGELTLPGSVIYVALAATQFHFNQFGLDGQGAKTLFLLPLATRDVLAGKTLALLAYCAAQNALLLVLIGVVVHPSVTDVAGAALLAACLAVAHATLGHWISVLYPRPLAMNRMNSQGLSGANLLPLGVGMVSGALFGALYALVSWQAAPARVFVLAILLLGLIVAYRAALPRAADFVDARREKLVELLG